MKPPDIPLAERMRPSAIDELAGQQHLTGKGSILRTAIENGNVPSMILWGPPGTGKTTIANIIAHSLESSFFSVKRYKQWSKRSTRNNRTGTGKGKMHFVY
jgi:putative ATPase